MWIDVDGNSTAVNFMLCFERTEGTWPAVYMLYFNMRVFDLTIVLVLSKLINCFVVMNNPFNHFI